MNQTCVPNTKESDDLGPEPEQEKIIPEYCEKASCALIGP